MSSVVQKAMSAQSKRTLDIVRFFESELNPIGNFQGIRKALEKSTKDTAVPFLPTVLSDVTMMNEFHDVEPDFTLNIQKYKTISTVLTSFFKFTTRTPALPEIPALLSFIEALPCLPTPLLEKDHQNSPWASMLHYSILTSSCTFKQLLCKIEYSTAFTLGH